MEDHEKLREIQEWGEEEDLVPKPQPEERGGSWVPLVQAALCLGILGLLLLLRAVDEPSYQKAADWFRRESAQEISWPAEEEPSSGLETPVPSLTPSSTPGQELQRL